MYGQYPHTSRSIKKIRQCPYKPGSVPQGKPCGALSSI